MGAATEAPVKGQTATAGASERLTRRDLALRAFAGLEALVAASASGAIASASGLDEERTKIAHLLRRAGFSASKAELDAYANLGLQVTIELLLNYGQVPDDLDVRVAAAHPDFDLTKLNDLQQWWLLRMALTQRPLQEKMTLFWHGFLTSGNSKVGNASLMLKQNQFFREHALGDFRTILQGISQDPAMLLYLDGSRSRKAHANENYARELMELFTTGQGPYSEDDVRESARAFTGWTVDKLGNAVFNPKAHDDGVKTFLGRTGRWNGEDIVNILVEHPATGVRLARKLFAFFAYDGPKPEVLQPMIDAYHNEGFSVQAMLRTLFTSDAFYSPAAFRARVKSPTEFVVGALRQLDVQTNGKTMPYLIEGMGQRLFDPPNVAGWPGGAAWLNSGTWLGRLNFINRLVTTRKSADTSPVDLTGWLQQQAYDTPDKVAVGLIDLLLDGSVSDQARSVLTEYARSGRNPKVTGPVWNDARWVDERARGLAYLLMAMPEYHLN